MARRSNAMESKTEAKVTQAMQVVDHERSEVSPQRRRTNDGRLLHCCCICGHLNVWSSGWSTYCSERQIDEGDLIPKFCSDNCRVAGGVAARKVTREMMRRARDAEWREPNIVYREATDSEKYADARERQRSQKRK